MCKSISDISDFVVVPDLCHSEGPAFGANDPNKTVYSGRFRLSPLVTFKVCDSCQSKIMSIEFLGKIMT